MGFLVGSPWSVPTTVTSVTLDGGAKRAGPGAPTSVEGTGDGAPSSGQGYVLGIRGTKVENEVRMYCGGS